MTAAPIAVRCTRRLRLRPDVYAATEADGTVSLLHGTERGERLGRLTERENAVLRWLAGGWRTEAELHSALAGSTLPSRLRAGGWLTVELGHAGRTLVTVRPVAPNHRPRPAAAASPLLSRFAVLRRDGDALVLESPLATAVVTVHAAALAVVHHLATTAGATTAGATATTNGAGPVPGLPAAVVEELVAELAWHGFVQDAGDALREDLATQQWGARAVVPPPQSQRRP